MFFSSAGSTWRQAGSLPSPRYPSMPRWWLMATWWYTWSLIMTAIYKFSIVRWPFLGILSVYCEQSKKYHSNLLTTWNSTFKRPFRDTSNIPHPKQCDSLTKGKSLNEDMRSDLQTWEALAWPEVRAAKKRRVTPMKTLKTLSKLLRVAFKWGRSVKKVHTSSMLLYKWHDRRMTSPNFDIKTSWLLESIFGRKV